MSSPLPRTVAAEHPTWCDPRQCVAGVGHDDVQHSSAPFVWHAECDDAELSLARYRLDSRGEPGAPGWLLTLRHEGIEEKASAWLTDHDIDQFAVARMLLRRAGHPSQLTNG